MSDVIDQCVTDAVRGGGVTELDERGLMPLAVARAILAGRPVMEKGEPDLSTGTSILASDIVWAALLSLADAAEACAALARIDWQMPPRGMFNVDLYKRYGEGLVPWLVTRLDGDVLVDHPWCVVPCLLECRSSAAFELVWRVREVRGRGVVLATTWLDKHPDAAAAYLTAKALHDARARSFLVGMRARLGDEAVRVAIDTIGDASGAIARAVGLVGPPTADTVLAILDASAGRILAPELGLWPQRDGRGARLCHGLRAIAVRDGDRWGLAIERLEGDRPDGLHGARVAVHAFGSDVGGRFRFARIVPRTLELTGAPTDRRGFARWIVDRIAADTAFGDTDHARAAVGLPKGTIVAVVPYLAHVAGAPARKATGPTELPSDSPTYQALARAISA
ncbi:MAG: hypothetical protein IPQ07_38910 [Myxococcales bacterium]|nr:hypothetical protein [Myxococcales bacterium]